MNLSKDRTILIMIFVANLLLIRLGQELRTENSHECSKLEHEIREFLSVFVLKNELLALIRLLFKPVLGIYDSRGLALLTQLRVGLSKLNFRKFRHNFKRLSH